MGVKNVWKKFFIKNSNKILDPIPLLLIFLADTIIDHEARQCFHILNSVGVKLV